MPDYNSSLPVRTEAAGDVVVKLGDATTPAQQASVDASGRVLARITDTTGNSLSSTSNALNVFISGGSIGGTADRVAFTYGTTNQTVIGGVFQDTSPTVTAGQQAGVRISANRALHINIRDAAGNEKLGSSTSANSLPVVIASDQAAVPVSQSGTWTVQPGNTANTTAWLVRDSADGSIAPGTAPSNAQVGGLVFNSTAPTFTTGQAGALQGDANGNLKVALTAALPTGSNTIGIVNQGTANTNANGWFTRLTDGTNNVGVKAASTAAVAADPSLVVALSPNSPIPTGTNNIGNVGILIGGTANSATNPLYVASSNQPGTAVDAYNTTASVAAAATTTYNYTVTAARTFYGEMVWASGSGKIKAEVQFETGSATNVFNTFWVGFNSTANPNIQIPVTKLQVAGARIRVIITNRDNQSQDVYATISGSEIA